MIFDLIRAFAQLNDRYIRRLIFVMVPAALAGLVVLYLLIRGVMGLDLMTQNAWYNIFNPFHWMLRAEFSHGAERAIERLQEQKEYERALRVLETELRNAVPWATRWAWLMLSPVVGLVLATIFMRPICARVDRSFFPHLPRVKERGFEPRALGIFLAKFLAVNILLMPLLRFPVYGQVLYLAFNGYIVGREMFNNAAGRRIDAEQTKRLRRPNYFRVWIAGMFMTLLWVVPGLNLIGPVIAPAFTLQLVERLRGTDRRTSAGR